MNPLRGICTNIGNCSLADQSAPLFIQKNDAFVCPRCSHPLIDAPVIAANKKRTSIVIVGLIILFVCLAAFLYTSRNTGNGAGNAQAVVGKQNVSMLRFAGSNTIGSELLPALAEAYMKLQGVAQVTIIKKNDGNETILISATHPSPQNTIEIASHGSSTAFKGLAARTTDIGMSSRKIKMGEISTMALLGDMSTPKTEHVLALDGIAVIVHPGNPITTLTKEQIAAIFSGVITDWAELNLTPGPIHIYSRDFKSGTYDTFKSVVLENLELVKDARLFEDSNMLSERVASDPNGIGFVGLPFVRNARALAVSEKGTAPLLPNRLTIATEDYPLARRLYIYTPAKIDNPHVQKFAAFALSKAGQDIVKKFGFVELNLETSHPPAKSDAPDEYRRLTANAQRISLNFRFTSGSRKLDNKAIRDLERVIGYVEEAKAKNRPIMLFGFSDAVGDDTINLKLSRERANTVAEELTKRGIKLSHVTGFGAAMPVSSNRTKEGRERNRRVEIWIEN